MQDTLPTDDYSVTLRRLTDNPAMIKSTGLVETQTFLGRSETWVITTIRIDGRDTILLQHIHANGGSQIILPPDVCEKITRQRDAVVALANRRRARKAAATRSLVKKSTT